MTAFNREIRPRNFMNIHTPIESQAFGLVRHYSKKAEVLINFKRRII